jgi:hypothetical protein
LNPSSDQLSAVSDSSTPISDKAVEAACEAYENDGQGYTTWANLSESSKEECRVEMRRALSAAARFDDALESERRENERLREALKWFTDDHVSVRYDDHEWPKHIDECPACLAELALATPPEGEEGT